MVLFIGFTTLLQICVAATWDGVFSIPSSVRFFEVNLDIIRLLCEYIYTGTATESLGAATLSGNGFERLVMCIYGGKALNNVVQDVKKMSNEDRNTVL